MNFFKNMGTYIQLASEVWQVLQELQADGSLGKIETALTAGQSELNTPAVQGLLTKLKALAAHPAP